MLKAPTEFLRLRFPRFRYLLDGDLAFPRPKTPSSNVLLQSLRWKTEAPAPATPKRSSTNLLRSAVVTDFPSNPSTPNDDFFRTIDTLEYELQDMNLFEVIVVVDKLNYWLRSRSGPSDTDAGPHTALWRFSNTALHVPVFRHLPLFLTYPFLYSAVNKRLTDLILQEPELVANELESPMKYFLFVRRLMALGLESILLTSNSVHQIQRAARKTWDGTALMCLLGGLTASIERYFQRSEMQAKRASWAQCHAEELNITLVPTREYCAFPQVVPAEALSALQFCLRRVLRIKTPIDHQLATVTAALKLLRYRAMHYQPTMVMQDVTHRIQLCNVFETKLRQQVEKNAMAAPPLKIDVTVATIFAVTYILKAGHTVPEPQLRYLARLIDGLHPGSIPRKLQLQFRKLRQSVSHPELCASVSRKLRHAAHYAATHTFTFPEPLSSPDRIAAS